MVLNSLSSAALQAQAEVDDTLQFGCMAREVEPVIGPLLRSGCGILARGQVGTRRSIVGSIETVWIIHSAPVVVCGAR